MFFATLYGENTESAGPLLNLQELLNVENIYKLQILNFSHKWHKNGFLVSFNDISDTLVTYTSTTQDTLYASRASFYKPRYRTNIGKQTTKAMAIDIWQQLPIELKTASSWNFTKKVKKYLVTKEFHTA